MKLIRLLIPTFSALLFLITGCSKEDKEEITNNFPFTTQEVMALVYGQTLDGQTLKGLDNTPYNPIGFCCSGDTLFIANQAGEASGLIVVRISTNEVLKKMTSWQYNGTTEVFDNAVMDVAVNNQFIFVVNRSSRIDMFRRDDYTYVTTIGRTGWQQSSLLQCESADLVGDKLFIRDKHRIKVVRLEDCTPENRFKVPIFAESQDSTAPNNGFALESVRTHEGKVYVTDFVTSKIFVIEAESVQTKGEKLKFLRSYTLPSQPLGLDFYQGDLFVTCNNKQIIRLNPETGEIKERFSSFAGGNTWGITSRIRFVNDQFYLGGVSGGANLTNGIIKQGKVMFMEFSELD